MLEYQFQNLTAQSVAVLDTLQNTQKDTLKYISSGVVCHAFLLLKKLELIDLILQEESIKLSEIDLESQNQLIVEAACKELEANNVLTKKDNRYFLTKFGKELNKYAGLIFYIYEGYANVFANFFQQKKIKKTQKLINDEAVVIGSDYLAQNFINPCIIRHLIDLQPTNGTICDLGCGDCSRLSLITKITKLNGLGIEISDDAIRLAKKSIYDFSKLNIVKGDITNLENIYPNVTLLLQTMVMHDITPTQKCVEILNSYIEKFPNLQYFFYCDVVSYSKTMDSQLPGFDYIHAMLNIKARSYEETVDMFEQSNFEIVNEHQVDDLPNTYLWILKPSN